jgi:aminopeptidase N
MKRTGCSLLLLGLIALSRAYGEAGPEAAHFDLDAVPGKLPKSVVPLSYNITLEPNMASMTIEGRESVQLKVRSPTASLVLNTLNETLREVRLDGRPALGVTTDPGAQTSTLRFAQVIARGSHTLTLRYRGKIESGPQGLFLQHYTAPDGRPAQMLVTQMETTDARRVFPCWDEPVFRATFTLTAIIPAAWAAVGNMPIHARSVRGSLATVRFERTPRMPTYLLELTAGDISSLEGHADEMSLGVWAPKGREAERSTALANATLILQDYDDYFGEHLPLPKLDSIAIPGGFPGAMENWGAITYAAERLLVSQDATLADQQQIFAVQAHEMAHQWNGDLVTMAWWDDVWLNESFASWMAAKETALRHPDWRWWQVQDGDKEGAMRADSFASSHPIQQHVTDELQASAAFDPVITYSKGQAVLRMLESYLREDVFRAGIRDYIRAHALSNATTEDLWRALSEASSMNVGAIAAGWTQQAGFPLISASAECDATGTRRLRVRQRRFLFGAPPSEATLWAVPLRLRSGLDASIEPVLLREAEQTLSAGRCDAALSLNADAVGYYRVQYDAATLAANTRRFEQLPAGDRIALLDDQWALIEQGSQPLATFFTLAEAMQNDENPRAWTKVVAALSAVEHDERGASGHDAFIAYARTLIAPAAHRLGWDAKPGETADVQNLRRELLIALGLWDDPATVAEARRRFDAQLEQGAPLSPEMQAIVLPIVGHRADAATFASLHAFARTAKSEADLERDYSSLMRVEDPKLAAEANDIALSADLPSQAAMLRVHLVATQEVVHPALAWQGFSSHQETLLAPLGTHIPLLLATMVPEIFWNALPPDELEAWVRAHVPAELGSLVERSMQSARFNVDERARLRASADRYVAARAAQSVLKPSGS